MGYDIGCEDKLAEIAAQSDFEIKLNELEDAEEFATGPPAELVAEGRCAGISTSTSPPSSTMYDELGAPERHPLFFRAAWRMEQVKVVQSGEGADELSGWGTGSTS